MYVYIYIHIHIHAYYNIYTPAHKKYLREDLQLLDLPLSPWISCEAARSSSQYLAGGLFVR